MEDVGTCYLLMGKLSFFEPEIQLSKKSVNTENVCTRNYHNCGEFLNLSFLVSLNELNTPD